MRIPNRLSVAILLAGLAFALRVASVGSVTFYTGDEAMHVPAVAHFMETGYYTPDDWNHPPLKYHLLRLSMRLFGDNPYGWRMMNVLLGSLSVLLLYHVAFVLFNSVPLSLLAAALLAVEPLHITFSRSTYGEIPSLFFFLLAMLVTVQFVKGTRRSPFAAGVFLGLSLSDKWYYVFALLLLLAYALTRREDTPAAHRVRLVHGIAVYVLLPAAVYLFVFSPWFQRGYTLPEFLDMQHDVYRELQSETTGSFHSEFQRLVSSSPRWWFAKPFIRAFPAGGDPAWGRFFVVMNNFPVWLLTLPALAFLAYRSFSTGDREGILVVALFIATYLQIMLVRRPVFIYSSLSVIAFCYLAIAYAYTALVRQSKQARWWYGTALLLLASWTAYVYPFVTMRSVPVGLYGPLLALTDVIRF